MPRHWLKMRLRSVCNESTLSSQFIVILSKLFHIAEHHPAWNLNRSKLDMFLWGCSANMHWSLQTQPNLIVYNLLIIGFDFSNGRCINVSEWVYVSVRDHEILIAENKGNITNLFADLVIWCIKLPLYSVG